MSTTTFSAFNLMLTAVVVVRHDRGAACASTRATPTSGRAAEVAAARRQRHRWSGAGRRSCARPSNEDAGFSLAGCVENRYALNLVMGLLGVTGVLEPVRRGRLPRVAQRLQLRVSVSRAAAASEPGQLHARGRARRDVPARHRHSVSVLRRHVRADPLFGSGGDHRPLVRVDRDPADVSGDHLLVLGHPQLLHPVRRIEVGGRGAVRRCRRRRRSASPIPHAILAYAWGDMSTHFLQPFWAIPLLAIARVEFKDIVGYLAAPVRRQLRGRSRQRSCCCRTFA